MRKTEISSDRVGSLVAPRKKTHAVGDVVVDSQLALEVVVDESGKPAAKSKSVRTCSAHERTESLAKRKRTRSGP